MRALILFTTLAATASTAFAATPGQPARPTPNTLGPIQGSAACVNGPLLKNQGSCLPGLSGSDRTDLGGAETFTHGRHR